MTPSGTHAPADRRAVGTPGALPSPQHREGGAPARRPPSHHRRNHSPVPRRRPPERSAPRSPRSLADGVEAPSQVDGRRHLGYGSDATDRPSGLSQWDRLDGLSRLDDQPGSPARLEHGPVGEGHQRPTSGSKSFALATGGEPASHATGRSRGGLTTKIHHAVDGNGRPLAVVVTPGQVHDAQVLPLLLGDIRVPRFGRGRPRTTPDALLADKAYSSKRIRADLAVRGIRTVIPERADQQANRKRKGRSGGRPRTLDTKTYKRGNSDAAPALDHKLLDHRLLPVPRAMPYPSRIRRPGTPCCEEPARRGIWGVAEVVPVFAKPCPRTDQTLARGVRARTSAVLAARCCRGDAEAGSGRPGRGRPEPLVPSP